MSGTVFTVGHSTHSIQRFIDLLKAAGINAVIDVRSSPFSRMNPQFNRGELKSALKAAGIGYKFMGRELGARSEDVSVYRNGQVQFDRLAETDLFKSGIDRVVAGLKSYRMAFMCAEKEPIECHRTILVARCLTQRGVEVKHIRSDASVEDHKILLNRLAEKLNIIPEDMLRPKELVWSEAYEKQAEQIAYRTDGGSGERDKFSEENAKRKVS